MIKPTMKDNISASNPDIVIDLWVGRQGLLYNQEVKIQYVQSAWIKPIFISITDVAQNFQANFK